MSQSSYDTLQRLTRIHCTNAQDHWSLNHKIHNSSFYSKHSNLIIIVILLTLLSVFISLKWLLINTIVFTELAHPAIHPCIFQPLILSGFLHRLNPARTS